MAASDCVSALDRADGPLNFTVALGLIIGVVLLWLGRRGRVLWLQVWSAGLVVFSIAYLGAAVMGAI